MFAQAGIMLAIGVGIWSIVTLARLLLGRREVRLRIALALAVFAFVCAAAIGASMAFAFGGLGTMRRRLDVSLRYAIVSWCFAVLAILATLMATFTLSFATIAVIFAVLGWITPSILGYAYKIVGFLAWQHARRWSASSRNLTT